MVGRCQLYYITDRTQFPGDEAARRRALLDKIAEAARAGVDYIQLREKGLSTRELEHLANEAVDTIEKLRAENPELKSRLLINSRVDVALAVGADGVHLRSDDIAPHAVREVIRNSGQRPPTTGYFLIAASCHCKSEVLRAERERADFAVFAPVFEKRDQPESLPAGLTALHEACKTKIAVFALGGVTPRNAASCLEAGAAGIAGIRLFQERTIEDVVRELHGITDARAR
jgi:thiamine-phosphate pyrophosphorylase